MNETRERFPISEAALKAIGWCSMCEGSHSVVILDETGCKEGESDCPVCMGDSFQGSRESTGELLSKVAPRLIVAWIEGLTFQELDQLRFATNAQWCDKMRAELRLLAEVPQ